ncbi:MAG: hypothetical protein AAB664_02320, partial [Patescibacteria group bacterium]
MAIKKTAAKKRVPVHRLSVRSSEKDDEPVVSNTNVSLVLYRRIALAFIAVVSIVLVIVVYLSTVEATILVTPMQKPFTSDLIVQTAVNPVNPTDVKGAVVTGTLHKTKTFIPTGTGAKKIEGFAKGNLTITNKTSISQSLVATTRFLSKEGVLFRLEKSVIVPANGSVVASVYADKIGASGNIPASHFTIPGLSPVKQASIYADSTVAFTGGEQAIAVVSKEELDAAIKTTQEEIVQDAKDMLRAQSGGTFDGEEFTAKITDQKTSIKPETESKSFEVTLTVSITGVFYEKVTLTKLMAKHVYEGVGQGQDIADTDVTTTTVKIEHVDQKQKTASLHAHLEGNLIATRTSKLLDASRFVGLSEQEVKDLLLKDDFASSVEVRFFPFWITRVPHLK